MVSPTVLWAIVGFVYYLIGGSLAVSIPFYVVAFGYWTWFRLTMDVRFDKLCREIGEIASRPVPGPVS